VGLHGPPRIFEFSGGRDNQRRSVVRVSRESNVHHRTEAISIVDSEHQKTVKVFLRQNGVGETVTTYPNPIKARKADMVLVTATPYVSIIGKITGTVAANNVDRRPL